MEVVPKRTDMAITLESTSMDSSRPLPDRMENMAAQAKGKSKPQLMLGGFGIG